MKRRISLVIAFALSFLMIFGSIARADEIKVPISVSTSEPTNLEIIIKVPLTETEKADSPPSQEKTSKLEEKELGTECNLGTGWNECRTISGTPGQCKQEGNIPCAYCEPWGSMTCGECTTSNGKGYWSIGAKGPICRGCP